MKYNGFTKGFITGSLIGSALGMFMETPDAKTVSRMRRRTMRAMKSFGSAVEDFISGK